MGDGSYSSHASPGIWQSLNRFVLTLIVCALCVPIGYAFLPEVKKRKENEALIEELQAKIEQQRMLQQWHLREAQLLAYDPEYLGLLARDRLDLMKEGETIYRFEAPRRSPSSMRRNP